MRFKRKWKWIKAVLAAAIWASWAVWAMGQTPFSRPAAAEVSRPVASAPSFWSRLNPFNWGRSSKPTKPSANRYSHGVPKVPDMSKKALSKTSGSMDASAKSQAHTQIGPDGMRVNAGGPSRTEVERTASSKSRSRFDGTQNPSQHKGGTMPGMRDSMGGSRNSFGGSMQGGVSTSVLRPSFGR